MPKLAKNDVAASRPTRKSYEEKKKERLLTPEEFKTLNGIVNSSEVVESTSSCAIAAIRILMYTECRLSEILSLKWADVFLEESYLDFRDSKTGHRKVPFNESAKVALLTLKQEKSNTYVFVGKKPRTFLTSLNATWTKILHLTNLDGMRIQDLRHTLGSLAIQQG